MHRRYHFDPEDPPDEHPSEVYELGPDAANLEPWNLPEVARCACGRGYRLRHWRRLRLAGTMPDGDGGRLELRDCECGSTIARKLP